MYFYTEILNNNKKRLYFESLFTCENKDHKISFFFFPKFQCRKVLFFSGICITFLVQNAGTRPCWFWGIYNEWIFLYMMWKVYSCIIYIPYNLIVVLFNNGLRIFKNNHKFRISQHFFFFALKSNFVFLQSFFLVYRYQIILIYWKEFFFVIFLNKSRL